MSDRQKAEIARHKQDEKATDEAYKAMLKRTQGAKPKADPWANLRAPRPAAASSLQDGLARRHPPFDRWEAADYAFGQSALRIALSLYFDNSDF